MTKGSSHRRARAEGARLVEAAKRSSSLGRNAEAVASLQAAARLVPDDADILARLGSAYLATGHVRAAIDVLQRSIGLRPEVGEVHDRLGRGLQALGQGDAAIASYREAVRLTPGLAATHARLADLLLGKGLRTEASEAYEQAAASAPDAPTAPFQRVMAHLASDRLGEAEDGLRKVIATDTSNSRAFQLLGLLLQIRGELVEAGAMFERAIELHPLNALAYHGLVNSRKMTEEDRPRIASIVTRLETSGWNEKPARADVDRLRMTLHFAAGKAFDDLRDYDEAMKHFDAANVLRRVAAPFNREAMVRRVERLVARFSPEFFERCASIGGDDRTPILIVGLPRSGTSLLERILSSHPQVTGRGELDYWNERGPRWIDAEPATLAKSAEELRSGYLRMLRGGCSDVVRATDKMPFNFFWVGLVHLLFPNAILIHCRRSPVDTCLSIYTTQFTTSWDFSNSLADLADYHRLYRRMMGHWRAVIPADRFIEVDYEDVVADPEKAARALLSFCGLDWDPACLHPERNRQAVATASYWQARQPIYRSSVARWRHYEPWVAELTARLGEASP